MNPLDLTFHDDGFSILTVVLCFSVYEMFLLVFRIAEARQSTSKVLKCILRERPPRKQRWPLQYKATVSCQQSSVPSASRLRLAFQLDRSAFWPKYHHNLSPVFSYSRGIVLCDFLRDVWWCKNHIDIFTVLCFNHLDMQSYFAGWIWAWQSSRVLASGCITVEGNL